MTRPDLGPHRDPVTGPGHGPARGVGAAPLSVGPC